MLPNWLYGKSKSKLATILGGGAPADYDEVKAQVTQLTQDSVTWNVLSEVGAVNYAPNNLVTQTVSGANFTVTHNVDDSITVYSDGVTKSWSIEVCSITIKAGRYILKGTGSDDVKFQVVDNPVAHELYSAGANDVTMTFATDTAMKLRVSVFNGKSYDNIVIYPMIAPASYTGPYAPYAKTNQELTDKSTLTTLSVTKNDSIVGSSFVVKARKQYNAVYISGYFNTAVAANRNDLLFTISGLTFFDANDHFYATIMSSTGVILFAEIFSDGTVKVASETAMPTGYYVINAVLLVE